MKSVSKGSVLVSWWYIMYYPVFITVGFAYEYFETDYQLSGNRMMTDDYLLYVGYLQYACRNAQYHWCT